MYNWRLTSFVVFTGLFWHTSMLCMLIVSTLLFALPDHDNLWYGDSIKEEDQEDREETPIKEEPKDEILTPQDTSSESPSNESEKEVKREDEYGADEWNSWTSSRTRHNRRISTGRGGGPSRSSGAGTALERERAIAAELQRRRSYAL